MSTKRQLIKRNNKDKHFAIQFEYKIVDESRVSHAMSEFKI